MTTHPFLLSRRMSFVLAFAGLVESQIESNLNEIHVTFFINSQTSVTLNVQPSVGGRTEKQWHHYPSLHLVPVAPVWLLL